MCRRIREYEALVGTDSLYITRVAEGDPGGGETLSPVVASIQNDHATPTDTQLAMEDDQQNLLVYPEPEGILDVLTRNIDQKSQRTRQDVTVEFSEEFAELVS